MRLCLCLCATENSVRQISGFVLSLMPMLMSRVFSLAYAYVMLMLMLCLCASENQPLRTQNVSEQNQKHFCVPDTKFVSATNVARAGKRGNICVGNNVSATMCPRLPVPLTKSETFLCPGHKICIRNKCCARG